MKPSLVPMTELSPPRRDAMYALLGAHFEGVTRDTFDADLAGKNWALLLHADDGGLLGFSTFHHHHTVHRGRSIGVVYSGDTIVDPRAWSSVAFPRAWIAGVWRAHALAGGGPLWWLLICSGFRTYRFLPVFLRRYAPRDSAEPALELTALRDALASARFADRFDPRTGLVKLTHPQRLRGELARVTPERLADPHVAFFTRANPGHAAGDELACVAELCPANLTAAGARMVRDLPAGLAPTADA